MPNPQDYSLFHQFINTYQPTGFDNIDSDDDLMLELEQLMEKNNQFFIVTDLLKLKILFTSKRSLEMFGIEPTDYNPYHFIEATHPDDLERLSLGRTKIFKLAQDSFISKEGKMLTSTNFKVRNAQNKYVSLLVQCYIFYSPSPIETVYSLHVYTNVEWCKKLKKNYHCYCGSDLSYFKYPDEELLRIGNLLTTRELQIVKLIALGLNSGQIAQKLFVSHFTINAHRANILKKMHKTTLPEAIHCLKENGII